MIEEIVKAFEEIKKFKQFEKVIVCHLSCMDSLKDYLRVETNHMNFTTKYFYVHPSNLKTSNMSNYKETQIYFTNKVAKNTFGVMTRKDCEEFLKPTS
jgi:hypothetical protein